MLFAIVIVMEYNDAAPLHYAGDDDEHCDRRIYQYHHLEDEPNCC